MLLKLKHFAPLHSEEAQLLPQHSPSTVPLHSCLHLSQRAEPMIPGKVNGADECQRALRLAPRSQQTSVANLTSGSSQGVVSRDMDEDTMELPTLPRGDGGSHCVVPVGMCQ